MNEENKLPEENTESSIQTSLAQVSELYQDWFLDYASYVILERAVPALEDGLKPVQRRILHAMKETDDGRFNKVANVIGNTMQYHPHGDMSIGDAIVNLGQKDLLIETQGNWGDVVTGDGAAASRYIEARLSKFALEVAFNSETTDWQSSYDGRKKEPILLPMKFPLVLAQGTEGIAVGLSTKILPHNFIEILDASVAYLEQKDFVLYPDFPTAGMVDVTNYNRGHRGGKIRIRSKIEVSEKKSLIIRNVPYGTTTTSLIESIIKANESGKIKIKQVIDNTAKDVEIVVELPKGVSPDVTLDALYAFTNCEVSVSPNACLIYKDKPLFLNVEEILKLSVDQTVDLLKLELEIKQNQLEEKWHFSSLEKIFIENRIYRDIEECETWEAVIEAIDLGLKPFTKHLKRDVTVDDIIRLTEIKIKRISKYDSFKADELIKGIENELEQVRYHLDHLVEYAIDYYQNLKKKYSKGKERKTEIRAFDTIEAKQVAAANKKLYVNRAEGFFGFGLKKEEQVGECSELDDIITFRKDGKYSVSKVDEKVFVGKNIIHIDVFNKDDERLTFNAVYFDGKSKKSMIKRFNVTSVTRDKEYDITQGTPGSRLIYFTANPLGETEIVTIFLSPTANARKKVYDFDFASIAIKGRNSIGNILTKYPIRKIIQKSIDTSNVIGIDVWYDESVGRLNTKENGKFLGNFTPDDLIIAFYSTGNYELTKFDLSNHYDFDTLMHIEMFNPDRPISTIYYHGEYLNYYAKRFLIETTTTGRQFSFIPEVKNSKVEIISTGDKTIVKVNHKDEKKGDNFSDMIELSESFEVSGWKTVGKKVVNNKITSLKLIDIIYEEPEPEEITEEDIDVIDVEETISEISTVQETTIKQEDINEKTVEETPTELEEPISIKEEPKIEIPKPEEKPKIIKPKKDPIKKPKPRDEGDSEQLSLF